MSDPCFSCQSVREACTTCGPHSSSGNGRNAANSTNDDMAAHVRRRRLVYLKKREEEGSQQETTGPAPHPAVCRSASLPVGQQPQQQNGHNGEGRPNTRYHSRKSHNGGNPGNSSSNSSSNSSQGQNEVGEGGNSGRSRSNSSELVSPLNLALPPPRPVTRSTSARQEGNKGRVVYNTRYQENRRQPDQSHSQALQRANSDGPRGGGAQGQQGGKSGKQQQPGVMAHSGGGGGDRRHHGQPRMHGNASGGHRGRRRNQTSRNDDDRARQQAEQQHHVPALPRRFFRTERNIGSVSDGGNSTENDGESSENSRRVGGVRITRVREDRKPYICYEMPVRLQMLLDTPAVPYEVASQHAWNKDDRSLNIFIKENDEFTFHRYPVAQSTDGIRSKVGYESGIHLFEINWPSRQRGTNAVVGVSTVEAPLHHVGYQNLVGSNAFSWGWDLSRKKAYHDREGTTYPSAVRPNEHYQVPDKFYAVLNMDAGILGFVVNGKYLGAAFQGLRGKKLHLIISAVWGNCEISMRYHGGYDSQPMPLMELCRHAVRKAIKKEDREEALEQLQLPKTVINYLKNGNPQVWDY